MKLFFTTQEVSEHFDLPASTIEHYVRYFGLKINKAGKNRKYTHADLEKLEKIVSLIHKEGYTLEGAKEKLKSKKEIVENIPKSEIILRLTAAKEILVRLKETLQNE
ncbi:MAG: MerR family transcriptional regulator [Leadbetterella sp.]